MSPLRFDVEMQLTRHGAALRSLAGELVRDPALADDAVHEVWLGAMQRPPRHDAALGGWLATALRNVVRGWLRRDRRRARREVDAVSRRDAFAEDAAAVVVREEMARRLLAAVTQLDAPFREAIWQRYFEGRAPREIAASSGVPLATVKSRLQRGLGMLRGQLGERDGDDWRAGFVAAFGLCDGAFGTAVATSWPGVMWMTAWTKAAVAMLVVAAAGLMWWTLRESAPWRETRADAASEPSVAATAPLSAPVGNGPEREVATPSPPTGRPGPTPTPMPARVIGRVVAAGSRAPLPDIEVRRNLGGRLSGNREDPVVRTGQDGRFELLASPALKSMNLNLTIDAPGFAPHWASVQGLQPGQVEDLGELVLRRGHGFRGRVVEVDTQFAAADVDVQFVFDARPGERFPAIKSDADGRFVVREAVPSGSCKVLVPIGAFELVGPATFEVTEQAPEELVVVVRRRPQIRGVVVDEAGQPVADIVLATQQSFAGDCRTRADGKFELTRVRPADATSATIFIVDAGSCEPHEPIHDVAWGTHDLRLVLRRAPPFRIEVVAADGSPIEDYGVALDRTDVSRLQRGLVRERGHHPDGRLDVAQVARGHTWLRVLPIDEAWSPNEPVPAGDEEPLRIVLQKRLRGEVEVIVAGQPCAGARVEYVHERGTLDPVRDNDLLDPHRGPKAWVAGFGGSEVLAAGETDAGGRVVLWRDAEQVDRALRIRAPGRPPHVVRGLVFPSGTAPLRVELPDVGHVVGRVLLHGRNRQQVMVRIRRGTEEQLVTPQPDGSFAGRAMPAGPCQVALLLQGGFGYSPLDGFVRDVTLAPAVPTEVTFDLGLLATANVRGRVAASTALPAGLEIDFVWTGSTGEGTRVLASSPVAADGSYAVRGLLPGSYRIAYRLAPLASTFIPGLQADSIVLVGGEDVVRDLSFVRRKLTVRFVHPDGASAKGQRTRARCGGARWPAIALFAPMLDDTLVLDPAPALPIEFGGLVDRAPWSAPVQMPLDRTEAEVTVVLPVTPK